MKKIYTTYDIAQLCNVDISTAINWIDSGKLQAYKTPGGHRRIRQESFVLFLKSYGLPIPRGMGETLFTALVVESDRKQRAAVIHGLKTEYPGIEFLEAGDGFAAGKLLAEKQPSLIILNTALPGLDGSGVCRLIKSDRRLKQTKIIALADRPTETIKKKIRDAGADDLFLQPYKIRELADSIKKLFS